MTDIQPSNPSSSGLAAIHERPDHLRRARPPDVDVILKENRVPLRAERTMKRDSMIGLKSIFSRHKSNRTDRDAEETSSHAGPRPAGIRASFANFSNWPYQLHSSRSTTSLSNTTTVDSRSAASGASSPLSPIKGSQDASKPPTVERPGGGRVSSPWNPPPLFQVYPQAVKHATLPACNVPVEILTRNSEALQGFGLEAKAKSDTLRKKRHGMTGAKTAVEWTSKIFVLVTSGYLLQYAAEGAYNRAPEKILQLTATSAAYASDLIPGRHWVLQVASATDAQGNSLMDTKSRRSKLSMRDSKRVSNMLLIFEDPEGMDDWLTVLRREIKIHGGKRRISETGAVEADDSLSAKEEQRTQRAVTIKEHTRFSCVITEEVPQIQDSGPIEITDEDFDLSPPRRFSNYTLENSSPTASMISADGLRLDNLRDSTGSHRYSYVSSGQRTMVTSAGSSPACSPTRASFSSQKDESQPPLSTSEVRLRPNAGAIANRRQSMQTLISMFETTNEETSQPQADAASASHHEQEQSSVPIIPNFSVPLTKRSSFNASAVMGTSHLPQSLDHERSGKSTRKAPPTALLMSRPLSIVIDQPSPRSPRSPMSLSRSIDSSHSTPFDANHALASLDVRHSYGERRPTSWMEGIKPKDIIPRAASSLGSYGPERRFSGLPANKDSVLKRSSFISERRVSHNSTSSSKENMDALKTTADETEKLAPAPKASCSPKRSAPSLRPPLSPDSQEKLIKARKSMPHLSDGPPPAPPPNCALPPIPRKYSRPSA
ncbi:hypothetical protein F4808DRAFT_376525 [Astrocystis sublimbata]|nr:hypothetical protein F4808DRAFT_376525 [Astrocystis sublimbata]